MTPTLNAYQPASFADQTQRRVVIACGSPEMAANLCCFFPDWHGTLSQTLSAFLMQWLPAEIVIRAIDTAQSARFEFGGKLQTSFRYDWNIGGVPKRCLSSASYPRHRSQEAAATAGFYVRLRGGLLARASITKPGWQVLTIIWPAFALAERTEEAISRPMSLEERSIWERLDRWGNGPWKSAVGAALIALDVVFFNAWFAVALGVLLIACDVWERSPRENAPL